MSDLIDRRAAIDAIKSLWNNAPSAQHLSAMLDCEDAIQALPSAKPELIRYHAQAGDEFYCGGAERRTDE